MTRHGPYADEAPRPRTSHSSHTRSVRRTHGRACRTDRARQRWAAAPRNGSRRRHTSWRPHRATYAADARAAGRHPGAPRAAQRAGHRDRRHALGRPAVDAQRPTADPTQGPELRELVRAVPVVLPVPVQLHERAVHPQPPRLHPPRALRLRGVPRPAHDRHRPAGGGLPDSPGRQVPQRLRPADPPVGRALAAVRAAGMGPVVRRLRPPLGLRRPPLRRRDVLLLQAGPEHQRADPHVPRSLLHRRARRRGPPGDHRVQQGARAVVPVVDADRHRTTVSPGSPTTRCPRDGGTASSASGTRQDDRTG